MARRFTGNRSRSRSGQVRLTDWGNLAPATNTLGTSGVALIGSLSATALALRPFTVVRVHMGVQIRSDQNAAIEDQIAAVGWAVVSDQASAIGVTAVPTPVTDAASDLWLLHQWLMNSEVHDGGTGLGANIGRGYDIDSKAMRKVNGDQDLVVVLENAAFDGVTFFTAARFLVKLH